LDEESDLRQGIDLSSTLISGLNKGKKIMNYIDEAMFLSSFLRVNISVVRKILISEDFTEKPYINEKSKNAEEIL